MARRRAAEIYIGDALYAIAHRLEIPDRIGDVLGQLIQPCEPMRAESSDGIARRIIGGLREVLK